MYFYSASSNSFYASAIHGDSMPNDAVKLGSEKYSELLQGQATGKLISSDADGMPILIDPPPPPAPTRAQIEAQRLRAYADPLTGSDRYFAEAQRESLLGNTEAAEAAKALGMARFAEIQAENPWPAE